MGDCLLGIEGVIGSVFNDVLKGLKSYNMFCGGDGNDSLFGNVGDDRFYGEVGWDIIFGSMGKDWFFGG